MLSFCNQSVHPFLGLLPNSNNNGTVLDFSLSHHHHQSIFTASSFESTTTVVAAKRDPGGIGFLDEVGGSVDGLMSCTESLGFESCDERIADDQIDQDHLEHRDQDHLISKRSCNNSSSANLNLRWRRSNLEKKEKKKFPPPLSSLNQDGKPAFFLRAVRTDGRLELKEVKIGRPETLRASRQDGRLRLHLIRDNEYDQEEIQQEDDIDVESEEAQEEEDIDDDDEEVIEENDHEETVDDDDVSEWKLPVTRGRCYELPISRHHVHSHGHGHGHQHHGHGHVHNNHPHDLHVWRQHCVTTS